mmetsp:Transcript_38118/g.110025  ORF Transcript_38118/g.110025 Transcript_38118/m.110025 type:complete len:301 (+) Transcript_38118:189-1091(+)
MRSQVAGSKRSWMILRAALSPTKLIFFLVRSLTIGLHVDQTVFARNERSTMSTDWSRSAKTEPKDSERLRRTKTSMLRRAQKPVMSVMRTTWSSCELVSRTAASKARKIWGRRSFSGFRCWLRAQTYTVGRPSTSRPMTRMSHVTAQRMLWKSSRSRTRHSIALFRIWTASFSLPQPARSMRRTTSSRVHSSSSGKPSPSFRARAASRPRARRSSHACRTVRMTFRMLSLVKTCGSKRPMQAVHSRHAVASCGRFRRESWKDWRRSIGKAATGRLRFSHISITRFLSLSEGADASVSFLR